MPGNSGRALEITILDIGGRMVKNYNQTQVLEKYNASDLEAGLYMVVVEQSNRQWLSRLAKVE